MFEDRFEGCSCQSEENVCDASCFCLQGFDQAYDREGHLIISGATQLQHSPVLECHSECSCNDNCTNRLVQKGIRHKLEVFNTEYKGFGLATLEPISRNSFVCEYAGEVLSTEEVKQRLEKFRPNSHFYLFVLNEYVHKNNDFEVLKTYVDPTYIGNAARFINHSCGPNLFMVPVRYGCSIPRLALFALRDIEAGEELSFDYGGVPNPNTEKNGENLSDSEAKICHCEASECSGFLPFDASLIDLKKTVCK